jgi:hypothetical protein
MATATKKNTEKSTVSSNGRTGNGHRNDGCEAIARASDGKLNTLQVRFLRILKARGGKALTRKELKEETGHWLHRPNQYHKKWVLALKNLAEAKLVKVEEHEPDKGNARMVYSITAKGKEILDKATSKATAK